MVSQATAYRSDNIQRVSVIARDMNLHLLPRKASVLEFSPQLFRQCREVSTLCVGMPTQHDVPTACHSRQYLMLRSNVVSVRPLDYKVLRLTWDISPVKYTSASTPSNIEPPLPAHIATDVTFSERG